MRPGMPSRPSRKNQSRRGRGDSITSDEEDGIDALSDGGFSARGGDLLDSTALLHGAGPSDLPDDEVERLDRGEELVRRRMRERKREKKVCH